MIFIKRYLPQIVFLSLVVISAILLYQPWKAKAQFPTYLKSVDVMKYTKDNICSQSSTSTIGI